MKRCLRSRDPRSGGVSRGCPRFPRERVMPLTQGADSINPSQVRRLGNSPGHDGARRGYIDEALLDSFKSLQNHIICHDLKFRVQRYEKRCNGAKALRSVFEFPSPDTGAQRRFRFRGSLPRGSWRSGVGLL